MTYDHLFAPTDPASLEYQSDPLGRLGQGRYVEPEPDGRFPDPGWETARQDWMDGAPLKQIFGERLFDFAAGVGTDQPNRRPDVFRMQALLHREGVLDAEATGGPTGYWGPRDDAAMRDFQKAAGKTVDGFALPGGETIEALEQGYRPAQVAQAPDTPVLTQRRDREQAILSDAPARFEMHDNPGATGNAPLWRKPEYGKSMVDQYGAFIDAEARRQGTDPDMIKAILYYENADGHKFGADVAADMLGLSRSQRPMSIRSDVWAGLGLPPDKARDPETNIRAAVTLVKRISDRLEDPSPEKIGTLWNSLSQEQISERGARIGRIYRDRSWEKGLGIQPIDLSNGFHR